ncbi:hypothetical protein BJX99DRAFT_265598 [Aspergillus californicus]
MSDYTDYTDYTSENTMFDMCNALGSYSELPQGSWLPPLPSISPISLEDWPQQFLMECPPPNNPPGSDTLLSSGPSDGQGAFRTEGPFEKALREGLEEASRSQIENPFKIPEPSPLNCFIPETLNSLSEPALSADTKRIISEIDVLRTEVAALKELLKKISSKGPGRKSRRGQAGSPKTCGSSRIRKPDSRPKTRISRDQSVQSEDETREQSVHSEYEARGQSVNLEGEAREQSVLLNDKTAKRKSPRQLTPILTYYPTILLPGEKRPKADVTVVDYS